MATPTLYELNEEVTKHQNQLHEARAALQKLKEPTYSPKYGKYMMVQGRLLVLIAWRDSLI